MTERGRIISNHGVHPHLVARVGHVSHGEVLSEFHLDGLRGQVSGTNGARATNTHPSHKHCMLWRTFPRFRNEFVMAPPNRWHPQPAPVHAATVSYASLLYSSQPPAPPYTPSPSTHF